MISLNKLQIRGEKNLPIYKKEKKRRGFAESIQRLFTFRDVTSGWLEPWRVELH